MDERLRKQLEFSLEIDKEKNVFRQTHQNKTREGSEYLFKEVTDKIIQEHIRRGNLPE